MTLQGHTCLPWASPVPVALSRDKEFIPEVPLTANKCRNPDNDPEGPWCYVEVLGNVTIDYCDVDVCGQRTHTPDTHTPVCLRVYLSHLSLTCLCTQTCLWSRTL